MFVTRCSPERFRISDGILVPCGLPGDSEGWASATSLTAVPSPGVVLRRGLVAGEEVVETLEGVVVELQGHRALGVVELGEGARSDDRARNALLVQQPGQRHVRGLLAEFVAEVFVGCDLVAVVLERLLGPARDAAATPVLLLQHAAEQP